MDNKAPKAAQQTAPDNSHLFALEDAGQAEHHKSAAVIKDEGLPVECVTAEHTLQCTKDQAGAQAPAQSPAHGIEDDWHHTKVDGATLQPRELDLNEAEGKGDSDHDSALDNGAGPCACA